VKNGCCLVRSFVVGRCGKSGSNMYLSGSGKVVKLEVVGGWKLAVVGG